MSSQTVTHTVKDRAAYSIQETAQILGVSPDSVRRWIYRGELPAYRYGTRVIRIDAKDLNTFRTPVIEER
ncbi:MAG: helix-turn-helix domain-containing protein [Actinomycetaceae bacterium]|nr:helix-turn-helix domain-containing protein [Actinomycetaceae bacterium]